MVEAALLYEPSQSGEGWSTVIAAIVSAVVGLVLLVVAIIVGKTNIALLAIAIASLGLFLLGRDWLKERRNREADGADDDQPDEHGREDQGSSPDNGLRPENFEPDVSYDEAVDHDDDDDDLDLEGNG